ncbi:putative glycerol-3-phosphate transporter 5 [Benincasa hispida]|uniref:putative glycerol-3-phosphate transporter 5 n=1 Tax=Benincasa hispida TaxID=102211 RepID=UPI00190032C3|nr:putative glycerol-3-phosphate transporter 5 [Benincasa hispida]
MQSNRSVAPAIDLIPNLKPPHQTLKFHRILVLLITFVAYASFHASRKPPSIVKSVLGPTIPANSSTVLPNTTLIESDSTSNGTGWAPFNGPDGTQLLGKLDLAFLSAYSIGMYFAGHFGDRIDLRLFLVFGMMGSGIFTILFGLGYWLDLHFLWFFISVQIVCGLVQSIGWPCVVAIVGNWFGRARRGLIMGIWNSHTSVGNIVGSIIASWFLDCGWGWSFVVPGAIVIFVGILVFSFLVVNPRDIGFGNSVSETELNAEASPVENMEIGDSEVSLLLDDNLSDSMAAIGFLKAWTLPGVAPFAVCLFFSKLVVYTFLYWLPFYIRHTAVAGVHLSHKTAGFLSTLFDIGGVCGGILAGFISDLIDARAVTSVMFLLLSVPALLLYRAYGSISTVTNTCLMFLSGLLVNGPYSLITTEVAADLGTQSSIGRNSRALATVTAIIDGTGSVGAALGPLMAGYFSSFGWNSVFFVLVLSICFAGLCLVRLAYTEIKEKFSEGRWFSSTQTSPTVV